MSNDFNYLSIRILLDWEKFNFKTFLVKTT